MYIQSMEADKTLAEDAALYSELTSGYDYSHDAGNVIYCNQAVEVWSRGQMTRLIYVQKDNFNDELIASPIHADFTEEKFEEISNQFNRFEGAKEFFHFRELILELNDSIDE